MSAQLSSDSEDFAAIEITYLLLLLFDWIDLISCDSSINEIWMKTLSGAIVTRQINPFSIYSAVLCPPYVRSLGIGLHNHTFMIRNKLWLVLTADEGR